MLQQKNNSCSGARVMEEVTTYHTFDDGSNGCQTEDRQLLGPSRSSLFSLRAAELSTDRQMSDGPSCQPSSVRQIKPMPLTEGEMCPPVDVHLGAPVVPSLEIAYSPPSLGIMLDGTSAPSPLPSFDLKILEAKIRDQFTSQGTPPDFDLLDDEDSNDSGIEYSKDISAQDVVSLSNSSSSNDFMPLAHLKKGARHFASLEHHHASVHSNFEITRQLLENECMCQYNEYLRTQITQNEEVVTTRHNDLDMT
ncbi:hypothetical protein HAX54_042722 [Datura stramonium]|uniref:Uncharacterized protein n=1 Tax=Datura stramonium TaxID=4076 RepID=A0ABS8SMN6_DATST|nr:hypothetical protein [Datura stramonium]